MYDDDDFNNDKIYKIYIKTSIMYYILVSHVIH